MGVQSTIPDADAFNWVIAPAGRCVKMVCDGAHVASLLHRALLALTIQGPLLVVAHRALAAEGKDTAGIESLLSGHSTLETWAQEVIQRDLHELHTSGVIALWSSLEVAVEDTITLILQHDPAAASVLSGEGVRLPPIPPGAMSEVDARRIFGRFEKRACETRSVSHAYCYMLGTLGLPIQLDQGIHQTLNELNYVRNCLLHRGGIVDQRAAREASGLNLVEGAEIRIGQTLYMHYFDAAGKFASGLLNAAVKSQYVRIK